MIGFIHASYAFGNEAHISKSDFKKVKLAPGALVAYLQKGLLYTEAETHLKDVPSLFFSPLHTLRTPDR